MSSQQASWVEVDMLWLLLSSLKLLSLLGISLLFVYLLYNECIRYTRRVKRLPGPRGYPVFGNLWQQSVGNLPAAETYRKWAKIYGPVYQIQLGNVPIVLVNSVEAARQLFIGQRSAFNSRPIFHVFHKQVSKTVTSIGTSPWDESCKQRRKVAATALNLTQIRTYASILSLEAREFLREILAASGNGAIDVDFRQSVKRFSLNLVLTLNYGTRISAVKNMNDDPLLAEVIHVEAEISKLRDTASNYANYIPILRYVGPLAALFSDGSRPAYAADIGRRRLEYNSLLLEQLKHRIAQGNAKPCIQGTVLQDPESATLSQAELISVSFSMMAASLSSNPPAIEQLISNIQGAESNQPTLAWAILLLAHRQDIQEKAYRAIEDAGILNTASDEFSATDVDYVNALTKEIGRFYTVLKLALPKATASQATWGDAVIPANTPVFLNAWACNRDPALFSQPDTFKPERWLKGSPEQHASQFAFGFGGRMCVAALLAHNALYTAFLHLIAHFQILPSAGQGTDAIHPLDGLEPGSFVATPKYFTAKFVPRKGNATLLRWLETAGTSRPASP